MANVFAVKSGNWSDPTVWNTGALPTTADDVWANTFIITIDISPTVLSIRTTSTTGITAGGRFVATNAIIVTLTGLGLVSATSPSFLSSLTSGQSCEVRGNISQTTNGGVALLNNSSGYVKITGNISNGSINGSITVQNSSSGIIDIIGNVSAYSFSFGTNLNTGVVNSSSGTINIIGNVSNIVSDRIPEANGVRNDGAGTINITGTITGGTAINGSGTAIAVINAGIGTINVNGNVLAGTSSGDSTAISNNSSGVVNINGSITGGSSAAIRNNSSGRIIHIGTISASATFPAVAVGSTSQRTLLTGPFIGSAQGVPACAAARWEWYTPLVGSTYMTAVRAESDGGGYRNLFTADNSAISSAVPIARNVRLGTVYGPSNEVTGTCAIPTLDAVAAGVAVDNTVGTGNFGSDASSFWNTTISELTSGAPEGSIGKRMVNVPTIEVLGDYLAAFDRV